MVYPDLPRDEAHPRQKDHPSWSQRFKRFPNKGRNSQDWWLRCLKSSLRNSVKSINSGRHPYLFLTRDCLRRIIFVKHRCLGYGSNALLDVHADVPLWWTAQRGTLQEYQERRIQPSDWSIQLRSESFNLLLSASATR